MVQVINYVGEYGNEVGIFVPYIHYLKKTGAMNDKKVSTYVGMKPYYFFLEDHEIEYRNESRLYGPCPSLGTQFPYFPKYILDNSDKAFIENHITEFISPDFHHFYNSHQIDHIINSVKPLIIINNKYNLEWDASAGPQNFFSIDELRTILQMITPYYTVVYCRTSDIRLNNYSTDRNETSTTCVLEERQMILSEFKDVLFIEKLITEYNLDFNYFKCILNAKAFATISILGGVNYFDAYFPSKHIIYYKFIPHYLPYLNKTYYQNMHNILCPNNHSEILFTNREEQLMSFIQSLLP